MRRSTKNWMVVVGKVGLFFICFWLLVDVLVWVSFRVMQPLHVARLRRAEIDLRRVPLSGSEAVAGIAARLNQQTAAMQEYNQRWWADLAIPDVWDEVPMIDLLQAHKQRATP